MASVAEANFPFLAPTKVNIIFELLLVVQALSRRLHQDQAQRMHLHDSLQGLLQGGGWKGLGKFARKVVCVFYAS